MMRSLPFSALDAIGGIAIALLVIAGLWLAYGSGLLIMEGL